MNPMPEFLAGYRIYLDGKDLLGSADVQLPDLEPMKETVKGAGIAGEVESPVLGHFSPMTTTITWRIPVGHVITLAQPKSHLIDIRGSEQMYDSAAGEYKTVPLKVVMKIAPKKTAIGKLATGSPTDTSSEFGVTYIKILIDGKAVVEIDIYNFICMIDGEDYLESVRSDLGL